MEDNDRTRLTYEGTWSSNEDERFSGGTSTFTNNTATVTFKFNGSAVYVYGDTVNVRCPPKWIASCPLTQSRTRIMASSPSHSMVFRDSIKVARTT